MFSSGQLIFAILFFVVFIGVMIVSYRRDKNLHQKNYKGVKWIMLSFITFVVFLFLIKYFLKN
ncbi:hypothetical protein EW142_06520 [Flagellimonas allohymeniacidonis]|uniref:Uncharacterized protein n=1 Tax=Flagellimonas allohymeniacidonis TaxID=2517819 RepID=A0A4V2HSX8_9FLAO|nr:hypothetical protein EW142_06520 [Allomuricauda hymeniacidonis]